MKIVQKLNGRHTLFAAAGLSLLAAVAGCGDKGSSVKDDSEMNASPTATGTSAAGSPASGGKMLSIAVIPKGTSHEYWKSIHAGAMKAKEDLAAKGTNIDILWKGTEKEDDRNGQVNLVETFVTKHVDGIVLAPLDNQALTVPVHEAFTSKIPVVIIDSSLNGTDWTSFDATNNEKGGELAGEQLGKVLGGKGNVIMLAYAQGSASTEDREKGFLTAIKKFPGITVLSSDQYGAPTSDTAFKTGQNLLTRFGKQVNGVFASNESNTRGMEQALKDANLLHKVKFVGFDAAPDLLTDLQNDDLQGLIAQNPFKMGEIGVTTVGRRHPGQEASPRPSTPAWPWSPRTTWPSPEMQDYLKPPIDQYLK